MSARRIVGGVVHGFALVVTLWLAFGCAPAPSPEAIEAARERCAVSREAGISLSGCRGPWRD